MALYNQEYDDTAITSVSQSDNYATNALLCGDKWNVEMGSSLNFTYSFPYLNGNDAKWIDDYAYGEPFASQVYGLTQTQIDNVKLALATWSNVANITFTEVSEIGNEVGDVRIAYSSDVTNSGAWGWGYTPYGGAEGGDVWISTDISNKNFEVGSYDFIALVHELGHVLGLKHPGQYYPEEEGPFLPTKEDNNLYSIMSYNQVYDIDGYENYSANRYYWSSANSEYYELPFVQTPMVYDILAMQYLYGANNSYKNGNDQYIFDETTSPFFMTIWDGGGNDTISVAGSSNISYIDLNEGAYSSIQTSNIRGYDDENQVDIDGLKNLGIAYGAIIENAIAGDANDTLIGNQVSNNLMGNAGADILDAKAGDDILDGGIGADTMIGGTGNDTYHVDNNNDILTENSNEGIDKVISTISNQLTDEIENLQLTGKDATHGTGNILKNLIIGNKSTNNIYGLEDNDKLIGWIGDDVLDGGLGADTMIGGVGDDTYLVDNMDDKIKEFRNEGIDSVVSMLSYTLGANLENLYISGMDNIDGIGNTLNNIIYANSGNNLLDGKSGIDTLSYQDAYEGVQIDLGIKTAQETAGSGWDSILNFENLNGSSYGDILTGNKTANILDGCDGNDILNGGLGNDTLIGCLGNDSFLFNTTLNASTNIDIIKDFTFGEDNIFLDNAIFAGLMDGLLDTSYFNANDFGQATDSDDYILYNQTTGELSYDSDGNGSASGVLFATLSNKPTDLTYSDFMVI